MAEFTFTVKVKINALNIASAMKKLNRISYVSRSHHDGAFNVGHTYESHNGTHVTPEPTSEQDNLIRKV